MISRWWDHAACKGRSPALWFPERYGYGPASNEALQTCRGCPVRLACLAHAMETPEYHGIWGGMTETQRANIRTSREIS